jgi:hypothetical protein
MNDITPPLTAEAPAPQAGAPAPAAATTYSSPAPRTAGSGEKTAWWITFGVILFAIVAMLSLWN